MHPAAAAIAGLPSLRDGVGKRPDGRVAPDAGGTAAWASRRGVGSAIDSPMESFRALLRNPDRWGRVDLGITLETTSVIGSSESLVR